MTQPAPTPAASPETILTVTHWTIRTRILASFTIILLVMALMSGVAYRRLSAIEHETTVMRTDALPGLNFSAGMRGVWGEIYVLAWQTVTAADAPQRARLLAQTQDAMQRLDRLEQQYDATIVREDDRARFHNYQAVRARYQQAAQPYLDPLSGRMPPRPRPPCAAARTTSGLMAGSCCRTSSTTTARSMSGPPLASSTRW
jgi:methyl-accepting chemotaxis protein WspA